MKRANQRELKFTTFLWTCLCIQIVVCIGGPSPQDLVAKTQLTSNIVNASKNPKNGNTKEGNNTGKLDVPPDKEKALINSTSEIAQNTTSPATKLPGKSHAPSLNHGALLRGFYVFVGLSVLVVTYIIFRSFRLNKSREQMVRKYGVLTHRQDVEMRPLPLEEEDEDDTTVFDVNNVSTHGSQ